MTGKEAKTRSKGKKSNQNGKRVQGGFDKKKEARRFSPPRTLGWPDWLARWSTLPGSLRYWFKKELARQLPRDRMGRRVGTAGWDPSASTIHRTRGGSAGGRITGVLSRFSKQPPSVKASTLLRLENPAVSNFLPARDGQNLENSFLQSHKMPAQLETRKRKRLRNTTVSSLNDWWSQGQGRHRPRRLRCCGQMIKPVRSHSKSTGQKGTRLATRKKGAGRLTNSRLAGGHFSQVPVVVSLHFQVEYFRFRVAGFGNQEFV